MTERAPRDGNIGEAAQPSLLRIDGVSKYYGPVCAIDNVTLAIKNREFFCLLGPSGCGKTTLMRMLAGLDDVSQGRILLDDGDITKVPPHKRPVNMMFQSYALFPHLTAAENIAFGLDMESISRAQTAERVHSMLWLLKLEGLEARKPHQLSGGQQQRVALARALVKQPRILLLDEPLGALDRKLREETQFELKSLQTRLGTAFVVVTHDQKEAMVLADRIAIMNAGNLVQVGSPRELYEKPATSFAAELLGNINLFTAQVRALAGDRMDVEFAGGLMSMPREADARPGQMITIGVRPEKFEFSSASTPLCQRIKLAGVITESAYFGDATTYRVKLDCDPLIQIAIPNRQRLTHDSHAVGDRVTLSVASENCISFLNGQPKA